METKEAHIVYEISGEFQKATSKIVYILSNLLDSPNETKCKGERQHPCYSPLWIRRCSFRWCLYLKALPHSVHLNLRLPAPWVSIWCYKRRKSDISFVQEKQGKFATNIFKRPLFSDRPKGLSACLFICPVFQSCNKKVVMSAIKLEPKKKKSAFTCTSNCLL